jgi:hypothetical protein
MVTTVGPVMRSRNVTSFASPLTMALTGKERLGVVPGEIIRIMLKVEWGMMKAADAAMKR